MLKKNDVVILSLKNSSKYFHPLLIKFESVIISATNEQITIPAPVKSASEKTWTIKHDDIDLLLLKIGNEKSTLS